jgi:hypothetical protein
LSLWYLAIAAAAATRVAVTTSSNSLKGVPTAQNCLLKSMVGFGCNLSEAGLENLAKRLTSKLNTGLQERLVAARTLSIGAKS